MGEDGDENSGQVEEGVDYECPQDSKAPDVFDVVEGVSPVAGGIEDGLNIEGREARSSVFGRGLIVESHLTTLLV